MIEFVIALVAAILLIAKAGNYFVDSACRIAHTLGVSQAVIALTLIAFATSVPEFFTSIFAAGLGNVGMSYGNVVGSNIINITPILALAAVYGMVQVSRERVGEGLAMLAIGGVLAAMTLNGAIGWIEGLLLLAIFALFLRFVLKRELGRKKAKQKTIRKRESLRKLFLIFILATVGVIIGARLLVFGGAGIAQAGLMGVGFTQVQAEAAVGFTVIAIGTSIPELVTIIISIKKKLPAISVGTIIGSNIFNAALVIGSASLVSAARGGELAVDSQAIWFSAPMMLVAMGLLVGFMWGRKRLTRGQGIALLAFYAIYLVGLALIYATGPP